MSPNDKVPHHGNNNKSYKKDTYNQKFVAQVQPCPKPAENSLDISKEQRAINETKNKICHRIMKPSEMSLRIHQQLMIHHRILLNSLSQKIRPKISNKPDTTFCKYAARHENQPKQNAYPLCVLTNVQKLTEGRATLLNCTRFRRSSRIECSTSIGLR